MLSGIDLLCSMIDSAAVASQQAALTNVHYFIPLILNDRIQLSNLITVLLSRVSSNNMNSYFDGSRLANEAIEMSKFFFYFCVSLIRCYVDFCASFICKFYRNCSRNFFYFQFSTLILKKIDQLVIFVQVIKY